MTMQATTQNGVMTIKLGDKFDFDCVEEFRETYSGSDAKAFVLDFRDTEYMDSSGLGMLLNMRRSMGDGLVPIKLVNCRPQVRKVLIISRFETKFEIS